MPTQNRRVATYLPPSIDDRLKTFKLERNIKGDSEALIAALSEYFQVSQEVAYPGSLNLLHRIEAIENKFGSLKDELLSELKGEPQYINSQKQVEAKCESERELLDRIPGQLELIAEEKKLQAENLNADSSGELSSKPLLAFALAQRFGLRPNAVAEAKRRYKNKPEKFTEWLQAHDPDGFTWQYKEDTKDYHLLTVSLTDSKLKSSIPSSLSAQEAV